MITRLTTVLALIVTMTPVMVNPAAAARQAPDFDRIDRYVHSRMRATRTPGLALAVVHRDRVVHRRVWGHDGDGEPITTRTPFLIGSLSKSVTALAVMHLVEADRIGLDEPVRRYLPWFRATGPFATSRITLRQLLTHTSGISEATGRTVGDRFDNAPRALERAARGLVPVRLDREPGRRYEYSDANYLLLGAVVQTVSGRPFGAYLRAHVFEPLDMDEAVASHRWAAAIPPGHRYHFGRTRAFDSPYDDSGVPYGYVAASLDDLAHYTIAQLDGGRYGESSVLSEAGVATMHRGEVSTGGGGEYALGWRDGALDGLDHRLVWHAGATPGYESIIMMAPEDDWGVIVLQNAYSPLRDEQINAAGFGAVRILLGGEPDPVPSPRWASTAPFALLGVVVALLLAIGWPLTGARRRRRSASAKRTVVAMAAWTVGALALAFACLSVVPRLFGTDFRQLALYVPDVGHGLIGIAVASGVLGVERLVLGVLTVRRSR